ncbi:alanine racemase [Mycolicibacterium goodii]|uniref:Alanine racemase n=1 Tax=Mycolicibacterium goodii TaxID=134601 RepID=A0ABS6I0R0_MYCGD|nr:alanine racemase [Mycolicibacterium goodii]MBU8827345.1 alanine racemase [Mycolicibacterium goodii]MBU8841038.1 alanine racemase [Mycolicibacterium goodii]
MHRTPRFPDRRAPRAPLDHRAVAYIDLAAIQDNVRALKSLNAGAQFMTVVKADGYGHGLVQASLAALAGGADWLGTALISEALSLRAAGIRSPILAWLLSPSDSFDDAVAAEIDLSVESSWALTRVIGAARSVGKSARVHLEVDSGMGRAGCDLAELQTLVERLRRAEQQGTVRFVGVWSHLARADEQDPRPTDQQLKTYLRALETVRAAGLVPELRHPANSAALLTKPSTHLDLVRCGLASYGVSPTSWDSVNGRIVLQPAMTLRSQIVRLRAVGRGYPVSYGATYHTQRDSTLALVPLGYADGVPRSGSNRARVTVRGRRAPIVGRVCMDQFVIDTTGINARVGDEVTVFGDTTTGDPCITDLAASSDTIAYEILTGIGGRVPRVYRTGADRVQDPD